MKTATHNIFGISKQRGIWLRCFLGIKHLFGVLVPIALLIQVSATCGAQCVYPTIRVSRAGGAVFDRMGEAISGADVNLKNGGQVVASTKTDEAGGFFIAATPGTYDLNVNARGFTPGFVRVDVGIDLVRALKPAHLWMILDVGSTTDACTFISTSHRQFKKAVQENTR